MLPIPIITQYFKSISNIVVVNINFQNKYKPRVVAPTAAEPPITDLPSLANFNHYGTTDAQIEI